MVLRALAGELSALGALALSAPFDLVLPRERFDPAAPHPTPVVFVHGLFGNPTNFLALRGVLGRSGIRNFASFSYRPRLDYQQLAGHLGQYVERVCRETGAAEVDVVGHSLGGLIGRYLVELGEGRRVRRLVTLGSPYYSDRRPERELAIFGSDDPIVRPPHQARGAVAVAQCGHWMLLYHLEVLRAVDRFLRLRPRVATPARRAA